eukprot:scaffold380_cov332-Pavlova_lutheri.AAC.2
MSTTHQPSSNSFATDPTTLNSCFHPFFIMKIRVAPFVWSIALPVEASAMSVGHSIGCFVDEGLGVHRKRSNGPVRIQFAFRKTLLYYKGKIPTFEARKLIVCMSLRYRRSWSGRPPWRRP